jgi:hypothetical protein
MRHATPHEREQTWPCFPPNQQPCHSGRSRPPEQSARILSQALRRLLFQQHLRRLQIAGQPAIMRGKQFARLLVAPEPPRPFLAATADKLANIRTQHQYCRRLVQIQIRNAIADLILGGDPFLGAAHVKLCGERGTQLNARSQRARRANWVSQRQSSVMCSLYLQERT